MQALLLSAAANGVGAWVATVFAYWTGHYFVFGSAFALMLGLILLVPLVLIAMARIEEIAAIAFGRAPAPAAGQGAAVAPATGDAGTFPRFRSMCRPISSRRRCSSRRSMPSRGWIIRTSNAW